MESANVLKTAENSERRKALEQWLAQQCALSSIVLQPMVGDASFRRYFRVYSNPASTSLVAMDAPPPQENCRPYVAIAKTLRAMSLNAPEIIAADVEQGFLLLTDFGDATYLKTLNKDNADELYQRALAALAVIQRCPSVPGHTLPLFTREFMQQEWIWHKEWFLNKLLHLSLSPSDEKNLNACVDLIVESAATQPQVFMHRDYHSANLMVLPKAVGILDFQDAFIGPLTYDLVSLLRDCYIDWPEAQVRQWAHDYYHYLQMPDISREVFLRWFDWMGLQRHLKALFTFARKQIRDQQPQYLNHVPRTLHYLLTVTERYPEMRPLHDYLRNTVEPTFTRIISCAR